MAPSTISVIGTGYVGLTTGACLASLGHDVVCADIMADKVRSLSRGDIPIYEKGLGELVRSGLENRNLAFVLGAEQSVAEAEFVYLCLPGSKSSSDPSTESEALGVVRSISGMLRRNAVVINRSTGPIGSTRAIAAALNRPDDVAVVYQPEFMREGSAVEDWLHPDRIVIGCEDPEVAKRVLSLYSAVATPVIVTDTLSAEICKYAANAFLATKLSFVNAMAALCEAIDGPNVDDVLAAMGLDHRIGGEYLRPGPGWGGSCIPNDTEMLHRFAEDAGYDFELLGAAAADNDRQINRIVAKVEAVTPLDGATVAMLGLAFKAGTDDTRGSPALELAKRFIAGGATVSGYDPAVRSVDVEGLVVVSEPYKAANGASVLVIATEWDDFRQLDLERFREAMSQPHIVDARNLLDPQTAARDGFSYQGLGRRPALSGIAAPSPR